MPLVLLVVLLTPLGCARSDWIGSTLVTVDVTGEWKGTWTQGLATGLLDMTLEQKGASVRGLLRLTGPGSTTGGVGSRVVEGTVSGDTLRVAEAGGGLSGELAVGLDQMTGLLASKSGLYGGRVTVTLRRQ